MADDVPYRIAWLPGAAEAAKQAVESGVKPNLADSIARVHARLISNPTEFGEIYRRRGVVEEYLAVQDGVAIDFVVDTLRKFVAVRKFSLLSRRPE